MHTIEIILQTKRRESRTEKKWEQMSGNIIFCMVNIFSFAFAWLARGQRNEINNQRRRPQRRRREQKKRFFLSHFHDYTHDSISNSVCAGRWLRPRRLFSLISLNIYIFMFHSLIFLVTYATVWHPLSDRVYASEWIRLLWVVCTCFRSRPTQQIVSNARIFVFITISLRLHTTSTRGREQHFSLWELSGASHFPTFFFVSGKFIWFRFLVCVRECCHIPFHSRSIPRGH